MEFNGEIFAISEESIKPPKNPSNSSSKNSAIP
jgi:hypothetical protein